MADLPENIHGAEGTQTPSIIQAGMSMKEIEKEMIKRTLETTNGNKTQAAKILEISIRTLHRKIDEYDLS